MGIDPDPRSRPDPDPAGGLRSLIATTPEAASAIAAIEGPGTAVTGAAGAGGSAGGGVGVPLVGVPASVAAAAEVMERVLRDPGSTSSHPVMKDDFAMGGVAMSALTGGC